MHRFFFFIVTAPPATYTLSLHDALPISGGRDRVATTMSLEMITTHLTRMLGPALGGAAIAGIGVRGVFVLGVLLYLDRKSTRLNSSHQIISYAVFCLKKKKTTKSFRP